MSLPRVAIVGRPNVGKSSLFNWLVRSRLAIVDDRPGVTRDRVSHVVEEGGRYFELIDTGGIGFIDEDNLTEEVEHQIQLALESAAVILFVVDTRAGLTPHDAEVAQRLRAIQAPVVLLANKTDADSLENLSNDFFQLGFGTPLCISAREHRGYDDMMLAVLKHLPEQSDEAPPGEPEMKLAMVGRRNVGKSTLVNTLAQEERMIVSEVPGTTRDSVDVRFEIDGKPFVAIDSPGVRKRKSVTTDIDFYSLVRSQRSIRRADVVFLFFDCAQPISQVDKQLCDFILEQFKPCVFVVNKWDLYAGKVGMDEWVKYLRDTFRSMDYVPISFITGQSGKNVKKLINHGQMLFKQARMRVSTGELNRALREAIAKNSPPLYKNRQPKIYYATQVSTEPPTIVLFCSRPDAISPNYQRYLQGYLRDNLPFGEVPIRFYLRRRGAPAPDSVQEELDSKLPPDIDDDFDDMPEGGELNDDRESLSEES